MAYSEFTVRPHLRSAWKTLFMFEEAYKNNDKENEYICFSNFIASLLVSENGYVIDTGTYRDVNMAIMEKFLKQVERHPILWRLFMVA